MARLMLTNADCGTHLNRTRYLREVREIENAPAEPNYVVVIETRGGDTKSLFPPTLSKARVLFQSVALNAHKCALCDCANGRTIRMDRYTMRLIRKNQKALLEFHRMLLSL